MATLNPFGLLLGDHDVEDPSLLLTAYQEAAAPASVPGQPKKSPAQAQSSARSSGNLPSRPLPPSQAVSESRNEGQHSGRGVGRGGFRGRVGRGVKREVIDNEDTFGTSNGFSGGYMPFEDGDGGKAPSERRSYADLVMVVEASVVVVVLVSVMGKVQTVSVLKVRLNVAVEPAVGQRSNVRVRDVEVGEHRLMK